MPFEGVPAGARFPSYKGQRNHVGQWWTATNGDLASALVRRLPKPRTFAN